METIFKAKWNYNWFQTLLPGGPIHNPLCLVLFMSTPGHTGANNLFSVLAQTQKCFQNLISKVFNRSWSFENFTSFPGRSFLRLSGVFCVLLIHAPKILDLWILGAWFLRSYSCGHGTAELIMQVWGVYLETINTSVAWPWRVHPNQRGKHQSSHAERLCKATLWGRRVLWQWQRQFRTYAIRRTVCT